MENYFEMANENFIANLKREIQLLPEKKIIIGLCTTSTASLRSLNYFSYPKIHEDGFAYFHLVLSDTKIAKKIIRIFASDDVVFFIDFENKNPRFSGHKVALTLSPTKYFPIEPNALTTDTLMHLVLRSSFNNKVLVFGSGSIAQALSSRLKKCNINFRWQAVNNRSGMDEMLTLFAGEHLGSDCKNKFDLIINCVPSEAVFKMSHLMQVDALLIDLVGVLKQERTSCPCTIKQLDTSHEQKNYVANVLRRNEEFPNSGRVVLKSGIALCSGGVVGHEGDLIVDNYKNPIYVFGIADGKGGFRERFLERFSEFIKSIKP